MSDSLFFYLFASPSGASETSSANVFYAVKEEPLANSLCSLFVREYSHANGGPAFHQKAATSVSVEEQILLDESLHWLAMYDDPDPGVYDQRPSKETLLLAQYAVRARKWEQLLRARTEASNGNETPDPSDPAHRNPPPMDYLPGMAAEDRRNSGLILLMLLAQAYYRMLECTISMASWFTALDLKLNESYFWIVENITNLLKNHEDLKDFPASFAPLFPDLYPSTISNLDWEDMVAPDAERFLSTIQRYVQSKGIYDPEKGSPAWIFIELFRPAVTTAIERAAAYNKRIRQHCQREFGSSHQDAGEGIQAGGNVEASGLFKSGVSQRKESTSVKESQNTMPTMPTHQFNPNRFRQVEELLDIEYEKLHEFERAFSLADGISQKIALRQQVKRDLTPRLRTLEQEYAELLAHGVSDADIPEPQAQMLVAEVVAAVAKADEQKPSNAPQDMVRLLGEIRDKLNEPGKSASAKLKLSLPIIPLISSYEMELDTEGVLTAAWRKARDFFKTLLGNRP